MHQCTRCSAELETPLGCVACGTLRATADDPSPFEVFGWSLGDEIDSRELRRRFLRFSRMTHPDYFGSAAPDVQQLAERNSALLNAAHEVLADDVRRANWIVHHLGGPDETDERQMPQAFLMEVLEWNETLDEARKAAAGAHDATSEASIAERLHELEQTLVANRAHEVSALRAQLTPSPARGSPALRDARKRLNAVRYLDRALAELEALRLSRPSAR